MGFFSELKSDLSQAVNTILPEEEPQEEAAPAADAGGKVDLGEMLDHLDDIKLDEHLVAEEPQETVAEEPKQEESQEKPAEELPAQEELAQAVQEIQAEEPAPMVQEAEEVVVDSFPEPAAVESDGWEEIRTTADLKEETTEALAATLGAIEEISRNKVEEQMAEEAAREAAARRAEERKKSITSIGGMEIMDITQQTPTDETGSITEGMVINGDVTTSGSIDLVGKVIGNVTVLGKLNITGEVVGDSKAAEIYAEAARITGEVNSQGSVKVGQSTVVIGNIFATSAVVAGAVKGDIDVHGPVVLDTTAIVMGNIKSQSVQINNGAVIEGMCSQAYAEVNPSAFFDGLKGNK